MPTPTAALAPYVVKRAHRASTRAAVTVARYEVTLGSRVVSAHNDQKVAVRTARRMARIDGRKVVVER